MIYGGDQTAIENAVVPAILEYVEKLGIGEPLNVPQLYGVAYAANPAIANTFVITDIQVTAPGQSSVIRGLLPCAWNEKLTCARNGGVNIHWN